MKIKLEDIDYITARILEGPTVALHSAYRETLGTTETLHSRLLTLATERGIILQGEPKLYNQLENKVKLQLKQHTKQFASVGSKTIELRDSYIKLVNYLYLRTLSEAKIQTTDLTKQPYLNNALLQVALLNKVDVVSLTRDYKIIKLYNLDEFKNITTREVQLNRLDKECLLIQAFWSVDTTKVTTISAELGLRYRATAPLANKFNIGFDRLNNIVYPAKGKARVKDRQVFKENLLLAIENALLTGDAKLQAISHLQNITDSNMDIEW